MSQLDKTFDEIKTLSEKGQVAEAERILDKLVKTVTTKPDLLVEHSMEKITQNPEFASENVPFLFLSLAASLYNKLGVAYKRLYETKSRGITLDHSSRCFQKALDLANQTLDNGNMAVALFGLGEVEFLKATETTTPEALLEQCLIHMQKSLQFSPQDSTPAVSKLKDSARVYLKMIEELALRVSRKPAVPKKTQEDAKRILRLLQEPPPELQAQPSAPQSKAALPPLPPNTSAVPPAPRATPAAPLSDADSANNLYDSSDHAITLSDQGLLLEDLGEMEQALECFDQALRLDPSYAVAWNRKGQVLDKLGRYNEALSCYDQALKLDPNINGAWNNKGADLFDLGRLEEALYCYEQAFKIAPNAMAWMNKGNCLKHLGRLPESLNCYVKAIELEPNNALVWYNRGLALNEAGEITQALTSFKKAIELNPNYADAYSDLGLCYFQMEELSQALKYFEKATKLDPNHSKAWSNLGLVYRRQNNLEEAIRCQTKAVECDPQNHLAWANKAFAERLLGRKKDEIHSLQQFLDLAPPAEAVRIQQAHARLRELGAKEQPPTTTSSKPLPANPPPTTKGELSGKGLFIGFIVLALILFGGWLVFTSARPAANTVPIPINPPTSTALPITGTPVAPKATPTGTAQNDAPNLAYPDAREVKLTDATYAQLLTSFVNTSEDMVVGKFSPTKFESYLSQDSTDKLEEFFKKTLEGSGWQQYSRNGFSTVAFLVYQKNGTKLVVQLSTLPSNEGLPSEFNPVYKQGDQLILIVQGTAFLPQPTSASISDRPAITTST
ncbi:MAG: tetratricopeptide repeat protein, partial [Chloroflexota bacterium]